MTVTAISIVATIFVGVAGILSQTDNLILSIIFGVISVCLFLLALFTIKSKNILGKKKINHLIRTIKELTKSKYELHRSNVFAKKYQRTVDEIGSRGFDLPGRALNGAIIDLYKKEFSIFAKILIDSIKNATANINTKCLHSDLAKLSVGMLNNHKTRIKADYKRAADGYWGGKLDDLDLNAHFAEIADHETKLQIDKILSLNKINEVTN